MKNEQQPKTKGFDVLRGIGIIGIVLYHIFPAVFRGGFLGVPLFFVLSGYLMFTTSQKRWEQGDFHIGRYYKKRLFRILPPLYVMVMAVCCFLTLFQRNQMAGIRGEVCSIFLGCDNWWQIWQNASYFTKIGGISPLTHLWFLALEIQLYLLWPLLFLLYQKGCQILGGRKICFLFLILALLSAGRMLYLYSPGGDPSRVYYGTDTMSFPILLGNFLGAARQQFPKLCNPITGKKGMAVWSGIAALIIAVLFLTVDGQNDFVYQGGLFLVSLFFAVVICVTENWKDETKTQKSTLLVSWLGEKSYLIYLWHYPIIILSHL